jgi:hypothetical protein
MGFKGLKIFISFKLYKIFLIKSCEKNTQKNRMLYRAWILSYLAVMAQTISTNEFYLMHTLRGTSTSTRYCTSTAWGTLQTFSTNEFYLTHTLRGTVHLHLWGTIRLQYEVLCRLIQQTSFTYTLRGTSTRYCTSTVWGTGIPSSRSLIGTKTIHPLGRSLYDDLFSPFRDIQRFTPHAPFFALSFFSSAFIFPF